MLFSCQDLIELFNYLFEPTVQTILISGGSEPLYLPKSNSFPLNRIIFTHDYYASALHEIAHWCIAGASRRQLTDYGYWYKPDGRNKLAQKEFEDVEKKPQALEWIFSVAAGKSFYISADNLLNNSSDNNAFKAKIYHQVLEYLAKGLPARAEKFKQELLKFYKREKIFNENLFTIELL